MTDFDPSTFSSVTPEEFAQRVKATPDAQLAQIMQSDARGKILDEVFGRMPQTFRPDRAGDTNAVIHWNVTDRSDGGTDSYEVVIENGACTVAQDPQRDPTLSLTVGPVDFLKVVSGTGNPVMMFMTGKLKAKGDLGLAANVAKIFDVPKA